MLLSIDLDINERRNKAVTGTDSYYYHPADTVDWEDDYMAGAVCGIHEVIVIYGFGTCMRENGLTQAVLTEEEGLDYLEAMRNGEYTHIKEVSTREFLRNAGANYNGF